MRLLIAGLLYGILWVWLFGLKPAEDNAKMPACYAEVCDV